MDKTCKSSEDLLVAISAGLSGARVRNTWVICPEVGDNSEKSELIPNVIAGEHSPALKAEDRKAWRFRMGPRPIS